MKPQESQQQIRTYQRQLQRLASELSLTEARERREIASDLHDHIGQALAYVSQKVSLLKGNAVFSGMQDDFAEILSILKQTIQYTRNLTVEISPPVLYELGLSAAIDWLAERASERHGIRISVSQSGVDHAVPEDVRVFAFKAIQELVTNAAKHSGANKVEIRTDWQADSITLTVTDNGKGFDPSCLEGAGVNSNCFGLFSIRERLSYMGGQLRIESAPGKGSSVSIEVSLNEDKRHD